MKNIYITITAMVCISAIEIYALSQSIDGVALSACIAILAGLGGYSAKAMLNR